MKKILMLLIITTLLFSMNSTTIADSKDTEYITSIGNIKLEEALQMREKEANSSVEQTTDKLIPYSEKDGKTIIPLADALKNIELTEPQIQLYDKKLSLSKKQYNISLNEAVSAHAVADAVDTDMRKKEMLNWREKLNEYENLKHDRDNYVFNIKSTFERNFMNEVKLQKDKNAYTSELAKLETIIKQNELKQKLGLVKASDIEKLNITKAQLVAQLNSIDRQLENVKLTIKKSLALDTSKDILLVAENRTYLKYDDSQINERIKYAAQNSYEIEKAKRELDLAKLEYHIVTTYFEKSIPAEADNLEISIEEKEHALTQTAIEQEGTILNAYYALKNLEDNVEIEKINVKIAQQNLDDVKARVKLNKAISIDEQTASINLAKEENNLESLINEYMLSQESFNTLYNIPKDIK